TGHGVLDTAALVLLQVVVLGRPLVDVGAPQATDGAAAGGCAGGVAVAHRRVRRFAVRPLVAVRRLRRRSRGNVAGLRLVGHDAAPLTGRTTPTRVQLARRSLPRDLVGAGIAGVGRAG